MTVEIVGEIKFGGRVLSVYKDLDEPLFLAAEVSRLIGYSEGNAWKMLDLCEEDEKLLLQYVGAGQRRTGRFVTELGLYNVLSQSTKPIARGWRRIVHEELISLRRHKELNVSEQFEEWDHALDNIYFDEVTGTLMESVTVAGGDVIQVPFI